MIRRRTIQNSLVCEAVLRLACHATAEEVFEEVARGHPTISRGAVYRNLQKLCEDGEIARREIPGSADRFDHIAGDHYHAVCSICGKVFDVDMEYKADLENEIKDAHGFVIDRHDIIFRGTCAKCSASRQKDSPDSER